MPARPRIAIVASIFGLPSEVWMLRQLEEFAGITPILVYETLADGAADLPLRYETLPMPVVPQSPSRRLLRRAQRRLGMAMAAMYPAQRAERLRTALRAAEVDAVFCHFAWNGIPVTHALAGSLPVVWQVHGRDVSSMLAYPYFRRALAATLPAVKHLVAVGGFQIDLLRPFGLPSRASVIPCGAPLIRFDSRPRRRPEPTGPVRIVAVGRLSPEKGVHQTLEAFARVAARRPGTTLTFVGDGPEREALTAHVDALGLRGDVRLSGMLPPDAVAEALAEADVFTQHSRSHGGWIEGFGVTLTEAGASGLPIVASAFGGVVDQVTHEVNGLLFAPDDVRGQADALLRLVDDPALRAHMGAAARRVAAGFDSRLMTARLENVLREAAEG